MDEIKKDILILIAALTTIVVLPPVLFVLYYMLCVCFSGIKLSISNLKYINKVNFASELRQNIRYEYGQNSNRKRYEYDLNTNSIKSVSSVDVKKNNKEQDETLIDSQSGDEYCFNYYMSQNNNRINDGIRHINREKNIDEIILSMAEIENQYKENKYGIHQLRCSKDFKKLLFEFRENGHSTLMIFDIENRKLLKKLQYKHKYYLYFYNTEYSKIDDVVYYIDLKNQLCFYNIVNDKIFCTNCSAYNFVVSPDGNKIYFIDLNNNLCCYDINNDAQKEIVVLRCEKVEWIDIDKDNSFLLLVESLSETTFIGVTTSNNFNQNELNIYEISTGEKQNIQKPSLFNVIFEANFVDDD